MIKGTSERKVRQICGIWDRILFTVNPDINALELDEVAPLIGTETLPLNGPISLNGRFRGNTGSSKELLAGLAGNLNVEIGPGNLSNVGRAGVLIGKVLSMINIFSGRLAKNFSSEGIPFQNIKAQTSFDKGMLNLNSFDFISDAINMNSQGIIDLVNEKLNIKVHLKPAPKVGKALKWVPIGGKGEKNLINIDIIGPLQDPEIRLAKLKKITKGVEDAAEKTKTELKEFSIKLKDEKKFLRKLFK